MCGNEHSLVSKQAVAASLLFNGGGAHVMSAVVLSVWARVDVDADCTTKSMLRWHAVREYDDEDDDDEDDDGFHQFMQPHHALIV